MPAQLPTLLEEIRACTLCAQRFAATETAHAPRPVVRAHATARLLIAGQAPGARVHQSGKPFTDPSGDRLRAWLGLEAAEFYDETRVAILPMGFCFPGYKGGADLPPPALCARTWRAALMQELPNIVLVLPIGGLAQRWHLGVKTNVTQTVSHWRDHMPDAMPLPHPSWRNTAWLKRNPWFDTDLLPVLRTRVRDILDG